MLTSFALVVVALWLAPGQQDQAVPVSDAFAAKLDYLRRLWLDEVGREAKVEGYKKLLADYPADPRLAEAMLDVAGLMMNVNPATGMQKDPVESMAWRRKAVAAAPKGSKLWTKAQFAVVYHFSALDPKKPPHIAETREILTSIADANPTDQLVLAKVHHELQVVCLWQNDLDGAERHCRKILSWYHDRKRIPQDDNDKSLLDGVIRSSGAGMVHAWASAPWPKADRERKIKQLHKDFLGNMNLQRNVFEALEDLAKSPEWDPRFLAPPKAQGPPRVSRSRVPLMLTGGAALAGAIVLLPRRRRRVHAH